MNEPHAVFVDDSDQDLKLAARLTRSGLKCDPKHPGDGSAAARSSLVEELSTGRYDLILLDYRLEGQAGLLRAGSIGADVRERAPDMPVVLVTSETNRKDHVAHNPAVREIFDLVLLKSDLISKAELESAAHTLASLARGYVAVAKALKVRRRKTVRSAIYRVLGAREAEYTTIEECLAGHDLQQPGEIARWILKELVEYPGPLLDDGDAAASLGLASSSFRHKKVQAWLAAIRYEGPFSEAIPRWWRGRAADLQTAALAGEATDRLKAIKKAAGVARLTTATCSWCGENRTNRCCNECREPTEQLHSVQGTADRRPQWAEPALFCFKCVPDTRVESRYV